MFLSLFSFPSNFTFLYSHALSALSMSLSLLFFSLSIILSYFLSFFLSSVVLLTRSTQHHHLCCGTEHSITWSRWSLSGDQIHRTVPLHFLHIDKGSSSLGVLATMRRLDQLMGRPNMMHYGRLLGQVSLFMERN